ncbi:retromer complex subunit Vps35 [Coemansia sp. RSA 1813]|nr:retromer complex subunit Vps35 [Coemansia sp. RSA 1646]KAJ1767300.1 retromer complex subunit Vps35 [Coemansia sp. RSA 1843]KAJ2089439.1 retromer complex subunit Vps35 [Coemansia sp. RSA 986]KAJ2214925.1 retromer complex subunit Vps35 [Coemansia sp. RSA 487]KAJ2563804.1 retromer complex subunit Vps35 [Coemansia sp. RSA 1813]
MSHVFSSSRDEQARLLDDSLQAIKMQAFQMKRCIDNDRLMDGLKHCSTMLNELRTSSLTPKNYYELYLATFDALQYLIGALRVAHLSGKSHLADMYELVQYAGSIVPRLYLMITIGSAYMSLGVPSSGSSPEDTGNAQDSNEANSDTEEVVPVREIMMDMLEMTRGVQHPTRGLFLRYYLGQVTKDYLPLGNSDGPEGNLQDSTHFILTNFVEMNKLWVRLQHQGMSRDKERREAERRDLRTLVGSNLLRLASLNGVPRSTYEETILPRLLSQVVSCRDALAQEYLMEALVQAFSDEWHLATIGQLMEAITGLNTKVSIRAVVIPLVDRVSSYAARRREELERDQDAESSSGPEHKDAPHSGNAEDDNAYNASQEASPRKDDTEELVLSDHSQPDHPPTHADATNSDGSKDHDNNQTHEDSPAEIPASNTIDDGNDAIAQYESDTGIADIEQAMSNASLGAAEAQNAPSEDSDQQPEGTPTVSERSPNELEVVSSLFGSFWSHVSELIESRPDILLHDAIAICGSMLRLSLACNPHPSESVDSVLEFVRSLFRTQDISPAAHNPATANQILALLLGPLRAYANPLKVLDLTNYGPLLMSQAERIRKSVGVALLTAILQRSTIMTTEDEVAGVMRLCSSLVSRAASGQQDEASGATSSAGGTPTLAAAGQIQTTMPADEESLAEEQGLLARLVHLIRGPDVVTQLSLLTVVRDAFSQGGDLVRYTYPAVVSGAARLLGPFAAMKPDSEDERADWLRKVRQLCRFIQVTTSTLVERSLGSSDAAELALQLFLMSAQAASMSPAFRGESALEEAAYEFIVQAFTVYEEHINESRAQYQSLMLVINALHASRNFSAENYETLAAKCVQHGSRLLKRPDQTRLAYACAQLWWKTLPDSELIPPPTDPGQDEAEVERVHAERVELEKRAIEQHNNGDKVLAHLQRSLKVADSCLDPVLSVRLFVELLNQSAVHYERRCLAVTPKYINDLIDLIRTSISNIEAFDTSAPEPTRAAAATDAGVADVNALYDPEAHMNTYVLGYFHRTLDYIRSRKELAASEEYNLPDFSAIHCDEPGTTSTYFY